jgi:hypothetical protein
MAVSVNRQIEGKLSRVMGQRDPAGLIRPRSSSPIRACGLVPRQRAGRMTAIGRPCRHAKTLASRGPSTHDPGIHVFRQDGLPGQARHDGRGAA